MATTEFGTTSSQSISLWSKLTFREALKATKFSKYLGKDKRSIIQRLTELESAAGDTIKYDLLMQMASPGVSGDNRLKGNEEALTYYQDTIVVNQLRNAHAFKSMSQQRTLHDLRVDAKDNLADWWAGTLDSYMFRYMCGDTTINHGQAGVAPDSDHYVVAGDVSHTGTIATDESSLGSNDQIDLMDIDYCKEKARTISPMIRPAMIDGDEFYVLCCHEYQLTDLKTSANTNATIKWSDIQQYANVRGLKNPIFSGSNGVYNKVIIDDSTRIYSPTTSVRRALFLGSQAGTFAIGNAYKQLNKTMFNAKLPMSWNEQVDDFGNETGVAAGMIFGMRPVGSIPKTTGAWC